MEFFDKELSELGFDVTKELNEREKRYVSNFVANKLTDLNVDYVTIACALLHETVNHAEATFDEIKNEFGEEIYILCI